MISSNRTGFWINEDIEARRRAGILPDDASYRLWLNARAVEKQRMLDALFAGGFLPGTCSSCARPTSRIGPTPGPSSVGERAAVGPVGSRLVRRSYSCVVAGSGAMPSSRSSMDAQR